MILQIAISGLMLLAQAPSPQPEDPASLAFAAKLDTAVADQDRAAILDANPGAITPDLAGICLKRGDRFARQPADELAARSYHSALAVSTRLGDRKSAALAYLGIGLIHYRHGRMAPALEAYEKGVEEAKQGSDKKLLAEALRRTGVSLRGLGRFADSFAMDEQSLEIYRGLNDTTGVMKVSNGMGNAYARLGSFRQAVEIYEQCLKLAESMKDKNGIFVALESLGNVYAMQGDNALALAYLEKSLALRTAMAAPKVDLANTYINLIPAYRAVGREADALDAATRALDLGRETGDAGTSAYALMNRASVYRQLHRYQAALADLEASRAIHEKNQTPLEIAGTLAEIAHVEQDLGHSAAALESARKAAEVARQIAAPDILWQALESEGIAYRHLNQPRLARTAFAEGVETVDGLRKQLAGGDQQGLEFLRNKMDLFHGLMSLAIDFGETEDALRVAERAKAGLILDVLRAGHAGITKAMTPDEKQREQELAARLSSLQGQPRPDKSAVAKATRELETFRSELYAVHPELKVRRGESEPLALADMAALLPNAQTALLEFAVAPDATYLFTVALDRAGKPELHVYKLALKQETLDREVEAFRRQLAGRDLTYRAAAASLYQQLLAPAAETLRGKTLLAIVPDGALWSLPFQALVKPNGRYLIEDQAVFYAPSLTVLRESTRSGHATSGGAGTLLAMGDPELTKQQTGLGRLPNAAREVAALGRLYGSGSVTLTGMQASEVQWKALAPHHRVLHLATHGILNSANPLYSYVVLAASPGEDGFIEAREILDLDLNAGLVVLSGCETGRGGFRYGEGVVGLSWALMVAGSPSALVSQWKVDSTSTTELMVAFHRELRTSASLSGKAAALRAASLRLLQENAFRHPFYWAGFVLIGDGY